MTKQFNGQYSSHTLISNIIYSTLHWISFSLLMIFLKFLPLFLALRQDYGVSYMSGEVKLIMITLENSNVA